MRGSRRGDGSPLPSTSSIFESYWFAAESGVTTGGRQGWSAEVAEPDCLRAGLRVELRLRASSGVKASGEAR